MLYNFYKATLSGDRIDNVHSSEESFKVPFENTVDDFELNVNLIQFTVFLYQRAVMAY